MCKRRSRRRPVHDWQSVFYESTLASFFDLSTAAVIVTVSREFAGFGGGVVRQRLDAEFRTSVLAKAPTVCVLRYFFDWERGCLRREARLRLFSLEDRLRREVQCEVILNDWRHQFALLEGALPWPETVQSAEYAIQRFLRPIERLMTPVAHTFRAEQVCLRAHVPQLHGWPCAPRKHVCVGAHGCPPLPKKLSVRAEA